MPATRKRKATAVDDQQGGKQTKSAKTQKSINAFGSVKKQDAEQGNEKNRKIAPLRETAQPPAAPMKTESKAEKKRKRDVEEDSEDEIVVSSVLPQRKRQLEPKTASTPRHKRVKNAVLPSPAETPSRAAAALFDKLKISPKSRAIPCALSKQKSAINTPPDTPSKHDHIDLSLPIELEDLQGLYSSFLTALSLYYAHNGSSSPADINALLPMVTKSWKRRAVKLEDIQRILALEQKAEQKFFLQDLGRAGICLARSQQHTKRATSYIDEDALNDTFEEELLNAWRSWQSQDNSNRSASAFLAQLPLAGIMKAESVTKTAPLFARGQQRLADLKGAQAAAKSQSPAPSAPAAGKSTQNRGTALLDRILAKQTLASNLPAGPTREQLERKAALHRVEDVARILSLLVGGRERHSMSMPAIVQQLQQSLRNPISKEEVLKCLDVMSKEITPGFVRVIQSGDVQGVVLVRSGSVGHAELKARVERALA